LLARDTDVEAQRTRAAQADTAIFYSISNCQEGLRGISFGNFLIKQVVEELKAELPRLVRFSTLSPIPGFRRWLDQRLSGDAEAPPPDVWREGEGAASAEQLRALLKSNRWWDDPERSEALRMPLLRLCAVYLTTPRAPGRGPSDPVARFHLGNGARLERINWMGNTSARGLRESYCLMVNYLYDPESIEANHEAFARQGIVVRSAEVDALLAPPAPKTRARRA
jgi:malonyl-CoA decarboxylase